MLGVERLDGIMEMLKDGQAVSIHTLSKALYISESTLRRDLAALQKEGLIRRIRGGAILAANNRRQKTGNVRSALERAQRQTEEEKP